MYKETGLPLKPNSLRRTISADMSSSSSRKWLQINSISMKRAQSSDQLDAFVENHQQDHDRDDRHLDHEIINANNNGEEEKKGAFDDIWSSILSNKKTDPGSGSESDTPYVHPLVKRTASSLSEKSLEICTESLGSETGSDGFGSEEAGSQQPEIHDPISNINATNTVDYETTTKEYFTVMDHQSQVYKRGPPMPAKTMTSSSFPPPLPSLSHRMQSHRDGGRLVVEAIVVPTTTCLHAIRRDGRLLLTLSSHSDDVNAVAGDYPLRQLGAQDNFNEDDNDHDDDYERKELTIEFVMEEKASCRMIMSKLIGGEWRRPRNFNTTVIKDLDDDEEEDVKFPAPETPPLNAYEYYWRRTDGHHASNILKQLPSEVVVTDEKGNNKWVLGRKGNKITAHSHSQAQTQAQQEKIKVKVKEAAEYLVPFLRGCKEPRRSLLFWEPHCIATS